MGTATDPGPDLRQRLRATARSAPSTTSPQRSANRLTTSRSASPPSPAVSTPYATSNGRSWPAEPPDVGDQVADRGRLVGLWDRGEQRVDPVEPGRPPKRGPVLRPFATDPDGHRILSRSRRAPPGSTGSAARRSRTARPTTARSARRGPRPAWPPVPEHRVLTEVAELQSGRCAEPDPERQPAARQMVERRQLRAPPSRAGVGPVASASARAAPAASPPRSA